MRSFAALLFLTFFGATAAFSQGQTIPRIPGKTILPLSDVKQGMTGTARTVFQGALPDEFSVEILGIVPGAIGPGQDMIIGKLSGSNAERTQVFAGMSGSPVYIGGKLVGAVSYSFPYSKEPICGITPIEQMFNSVDKGGYTPRPAAAAASFSKVGLMGSDWRTIAGFGAVSPFGGTVINSSSAVSAASGQTMEPISTPLAFAGVGSRTVEQFTADLDRLGMKGVSVAGSGSSLEGMKPVTDTTLVGGDSVVVQLARGDMNVSAAGTVTLRDGNKVHAFGHQYFALGGMQLPMSTSHVVTVIPNLNNSFKLAVADDLVGRIDQDRNTGIYGTLGAAPKMIPVAIDMMTSRGKTEKLEFESVVSELFSPLILNVGVVNAINSYERNLGDLTVSLKARIDVKGEKPVLIERRFSGQLGSSQAGAAPSVPMAALLRSDFPGLEIEDIKVQLEVAEGNIGATIEKVEADRDQLRPGDTLGLRISLRNTDGSVTYRNASVQIPSDAQPGQLAVQVGDGTTVQSAAAIQNFTPRNAAELIANLNQLKRSDKMYFVVTRAAAGAVIGSAELPNLPPSAVVTLNNSRGAGGTKATDKSVVTEGLIDGPELILTGSQTVNVTVVK